MQIAQIAPLTEAIPPKLYGGTERVISWLADELVGLGPALVRMADLGLDTMWQEMPRIVRWYDEIRAHPAFKPTYYAGSLLTERFPHLKERARRPS